MGVGAGLYMFNVVVKSSCSLSHLLMSSCTHCKEIKEVPKFNKCLAVADMGDRLVTIDMGRKLGGCAPFLGEGELGPHVTYNIPWSEAYFRTN